MTALTDIDVRTCVGCTHAACSHFRGKYVCAHPSVMTGPRIDVVTGREITDNCPDCDDLRKTGGACGPSGAMWARRAPPPKQPDISPPTWTRVQLMTDEPTDELTHDRHPTVMTVSGSDLLSIVAALCLFAILAYAILT